MIKLDTKDGRVKVAITGNGKDLARELNALLSTIKSNESMQVLLMVAIAAEKISEEKHNEKSDEIGEMLKRVFKKESSNENLKA